MFTKTKTEKKKMKIYNNASQAFSKERKIKMNSVGKVRRWGVGAAMTMRLSLYRDDEASVRR
jgi:hypothetical protein